LLEHLRIDRFAFGASARLGHDDFHHRTHLCLAGRTHLGNGLAHQRGQIIGRKRGRQVAFENRDLGFFFGRLLGTPAFDESIHRVLALFNALADHGNDIGVGEVGLRGSALFDHCVFE
jgi:hypothetical protein